MAGLKYWIWFTEIEGLSAYSKELLLEHFGTPENIYYAGEEEYRLIPELKAPQAKLLAEKSLEGAERILASCARQNVRVLTMQDTDYPQRLHSIFEAPYLLYVKGTLPVIDEEAAVAMVGTRRATPYGIKSAEQLGYSLAKQGALIVSGAAAGIDSAALRGALRAGKKAIAVLGNGVDVVYPAENAALYRDIAATGALISEYPPGAPAEAWHFPARNRIISGLSVAAIVVEAPLRSGALITARTAAEQGRGVFAVPGTIESPMSRGCNRLIADGIARLITDSWDVLQEYEALYPHKIQAEPVHLPETLGYRAREEQRAEQMNDEAKKEEEKRASALPTIDLRGSRNAGLTDDQIDLLRALKSGAMQVDALIEATELPARRVLSALTMLELDGYITQGGGKHFSLNATLLED